PKLGSLISRWRPVFLTSSMDNGARPMTRRRLATTVGLLASMRPLTIFPVRSRTVYSYVRDMVVVAIRCLRPASSDASARRVAHGAEGRGALVHARHAPREAVEVLDVVALLEAGLVGDLPRLHQVGEVLVHRVHAKRGAGLHRRVDLVRLALADEVAHRRR